MILEPVYLYCERLGPGLWAEPLNLAAGFGFFLSAVLIWRMAQGVAALRWMAATVLLMFLATIHMHMLPTRLSVGLTIGTILLFVVQFFYLMNRDLVGLSVRMSVVLTLLILPFAATSLPLMGLLPGGFGTIAFLPLGILLLGYPALLRAEHPRTARGVLVGSLILGAGLAVRSVDLPMCDVWPHGTQFAWKLFAALLTWHLARVYRAHVLAGADAGR